MLYADPKWLGALLSKHARDNSVVDVLNVETESAVGVGDNYASIVTRATLTVVLGSGKVATKRVIIKKALDDLSQDVAGDMAGAFILEGVVYNEFLSKYNDLLCESKTPYRNFWPECLYSSHDVVMMEDLKMLGFNMGTRKTGLDPLHAKLVFTNLARLHSLSFVAKERNMICTKLLPPYMLIETSVGETFIKTSLSALADVIRDSWSKEWSNVEIKIRGMTESIGQTLKTLYNEEHKISVVNHGDCWVNNMLFRYNSEGCPEELRFVDFQISHFNSFGWDLTYFLHSSVHPKFIRLNMDSFIQIYCQEFSDNLQRLGYDSSLAPSAEDVKNEMIRLRPFGLVASCVILPITANPGDIKLTVDQLLNDSSKLKLLFEDETFQMIMKEMFNNFIQLGVL